MAALAAAPQVLIRRGVKPVFPYHQHALCAAAAIVLEAEGDHEEALAGYGEAATRWDRFGVVPERARALLGQGRCLLVLGRPEAKEPLREARELFSSMGYRPALGEAEALLDQTSVGR